MLGLVLRPDAGEVAVDAELSSDGCGDSLGVTGDHHHLGIACVQRVDGVTRLGPDLVGQFQGADDGAVGENMEDDRAVGPPPAEITSLAAAAMPGAHVHVLAGHGHFAHVSEPGLVAQVLRNWLE